MLYIAAGIIFTLWYVPQLYRLYKDTTGAAAISLNTLFFQMLLRLPALVYGIVAMQEPVYYSVLIDLIARIAIFVVATKKRIKFHTDIEGETGIFSALGAIDMDEEAIDTEKQRRHHSKTPTLGGETAMKMHLETPSEAAKKENEPNA
jgi:uncharacterized protein with PQ loop repeat